MIRSASTASCSLRNISGRSHRFIALVCIALCHLPCPPERDSCSRPTSRGNEQTTHLAVYPFTSILNSRQFIHSYLHPLPFLIFFIISSCASSHPQGIFYHTSLLLSSLLLAACCVRHSAIAQCDATAEPLYGGARLNRPATKGITARHQTRIQPPTTPPTPDCWQSGQRSSPPLPVSDPRRRRDGDETATTTKIHLSPL